VYWASSIQLFSAEFGKRNEDSFPFSTTALNERLFQFFSAAQRIVERLRSDEKDHRPRLKGPFARSVDGRRTRDAFCGTADMIRLS
jgi:hypothetical protein